MSVVEALRRELGVLKERDPLVADGPLAAAALVLAEKLDDSRLSGAMAAQCAKELRDTLQVLRALAPAEEKHDFFDELKRRRDAKLRPTGTAPQ